MYSALAVLCAWAVFLPIGVKYLAFLGCGAAALRVLIRERRLGELLRDAGFRAAALFWGLTALSLLWSPAHWRDSLPQLWLYGLLLLVPPIALACPAALARRVLVQFGIAAALLGVAVGLARAGALPDGLLHRTIVEPEGNQRIINSLMLALGASICLLQAMTPQRAHWQRAAWFGAAALALLGLALQDRRTGMVALPVLLAALGLARQRGWWRRLAAVAVVAGLSLAAWQFSPAVRGRIDEGLNEMRQYQSSDTAATSWGMRLRLAEHSLDMVREKPLFGHGVGSWLDQWRARVQPGLLISVHLTPHNEYLLVASQLGLAGIAALLWLLIGNAVRAWRAGPHGLAALLAWIAITWSALFNVVLRDAKFALPLLLIAGMAGAVARPNVLARQKPL
ncbi:O-antigen ligase family protein [Aquincola sp. S2]|uniref:O-antigen ligase family protein n=1 Tax=Pseudaquabacterium terrae TaxID=2732868 RepID=A0ABX2EDY7_9BURK|nr:O-antigen ligase family protein [Aquabacterium terrae]NRF66819.1 O-antigen ligase family protein [Aquabacterium terrae]